MVKFKFSLRHLLMPAVLVVFFVIFYLFYEENKDRTINEFNHEQLILARTASQGMTSFFEEQQSMLTFLSKFKDIIDFTENGEELLSSFFTTHKSTIAAITRVDADGIIMYTYPHNQSVLGNDISYQKHVSQVIDTKEPVISDVFFSAQGYLAIALHVPIFKEEVYVGSLAYLIPIDELGKLYLENIKIRGTGNVWLLSENGIEIYCPIPGHTGKPMLENMNNDDEASELIEKIKMQTYGTVKGIHTETIDVARNRSNGQYITFFRTPLGNTYWTILISYQEKDIYIALSRLRNQLIIIFSLLFLTIAYFFYSLIKVSKVLKEEARRKMAEKTLLESEEKFRRLFEDHLAVKLLIDPNTREIIDANNSAAEYYGWTRDELKQMKIEQINTQSSDEINMNIEKVNSQKEIQFEFKHQLKDGSIRDVEVFSSRIKIGDKNLLHSIIYDITYRKQIEEALIKSKEKAEESDRLKTAFLQNMSHEIRTPMNAIMGFSSLLNDCYEDKPKLEKFSEIITRRSSDLLEIINDILDISKIESGHMTVNSEECELKEFFTDLSTFFNEYQKRSGKQQIEFNLQTQIPSSIKTIVTDKTKLRQIFINLLSNAFKFTNTGKIEGGCKIDANRNLLFYVSDTGIGIPAEKQVVIFERFEQLHQSGSKIVAGTGLGLPIAKGLVELLGGEIWLESEKGQGTRFYFSIPLNTVDSTNTAQVSNKESQAYNFSGKAILVVEDDKYNTTYIEEILANTGIKILSTEYAYEAIKMATSQSPDLVLMDIRLPDLNGLEATRLIRQQKPDVNIIAQTAYATDDDKQKALDAGCIDYISKPMDRELLLIMIDKHIS